MKTTNEARKELEKSTTAERSAWGRGVAQYALDLLDTVEEWSEYNNGAEIPSNRAELKKNSVKRRAGLERVFVGRLVPLL